ncbi:MAG TPA: hypothetical protein VK138_16240 [Acidiferrobacterales bacterium]|nr:hypothetical protein [Acidiferrobacterales bacterium]
MNKLAKWPVMFVTLTLGAHANADDWHEGENLLQPLPIPGEDWKLKRMTNDKAKMEMARWSKSSGNGSETLQVIIAHDQHNGNVEILQEDEDEEGKGFCSSFSSDILDKGSENTYKTITWKTKCKLRAENSEVVILHKAISGEDSLYNIQKIWRDSFTEENSRIWVDYVKRIKLCNTRGTQHPCPEGFKRAQ